ncbi:MAG: mannose-1-phosphate guanylyltransferase [Bacteroidales bacterium]
MDNNFAVIMAGGIGSRFWPLSRQKRPKQFLDVLGTNETFIQMTFRRLTSICPAENIYVVTSELYKDLTQEQLPELSPEQILLEPARRNTAPCIAYASAIIERINPNANIIVSPADHLILKEGEFSKQLRNGIDIISKSDAILTIGITPSRPETGYGYIQVGEKVDTLGIDNDYKVKTFIEKPNEEMAKKLVDLGDFYWNSGIFLWNLRTIQSAFNEHLPEIYELFKSLPKNTKDINEQQLNEVYSACTNISIDYGVMEKAHNVRVICCDIGWSDLGTWGALYLTKEENENNNIRGKEVHISNTRNCVFRGQEDKAYILDNLDGYIIADTEDVLLICKRENEKDLKQFMSKLEDSSGDKYL